MCLPEGWLNPITTFVVFMALAVVARPYSEEAATACYAVGIGSLMLSGGEA